MDFLKNRKTTLYPYLIVIEVEAERVPLWVWNEVQSKLSNKEIIKKNEAKKERKMKERERKEEGRMRRNE